MKKIFEEFKTFIARGNIVDMSIGVVIGGAFGKITSSLVNDILMPIVGMFTGGNDLSKLNICIRQAIYNESGEVVKEAVNVGIGTFISTVLDFMIIAFIVFLIIKSLNMAAERLKKKQEEDGKKEEKAPTTEELLASILSEIKKR